LAVFIHLIREPNALTGTELHVSVQLESMQCLKTADEHVLFTGAATGRGSC